MRATITGKRFCITGKLTHYDRRGAERAILDAGGEVTKSVGPSTDFLVVGARAGKKLTQARRLGIPVIEEADLASFLLGDVVEVEDIVTSGDASVDALVGEARALLDGTPTSATWSDVLALVDRCAPEQLDALVAYLDPQIARWTPSEDARWTPPQGAYGREGAPESWVRATPYGELRVAPHPWLIEMTAGHDTSKYALIRSIHFQGMAANARVMAQVVSRPSLTNLRWLDLGRNEASSVFWQRLRGLESMRSLERLRLERLTERGVKVVDGEHHLESLRSLVLAMSTSTAIGPTTRLFSARLSRGVTSLTVQGAWRAAAMQKLERPECLPSLETLTFVPKRHGDVAAALGDAARVGVARFAIASKFSFESTAESSSITQMLVSALDRWGLGVSQGPEHLDLSGVRVEGVTPTRAREALVAALAEWAPPAGTQTLSLGRWWSEALSESWAARGVTVQR